MDCRDEIAATAAASAATSPNTDTRAAASRDAASSSATAATIPAAASTVEACTSNITACTNSASTAVQLARDEALVAGTVSTAAESTAAPESTTAAAAPESTTANPLPTSPPLDAVPPFDDDARARAKALAASYGKPRTQETGLRALHAVTHNATPDAALQLLVYPSSAGASGGRLSQASAQLIVQTPRLSMKALCFQRTGLHTIRLACMTFKSESRPM